VRGSGTAPTESRRQWVCVCPPWLCVVLVDVDEPDEPDEPEPAEPDEPEPDEPKPEEPSPEEEELDESDDVLASEAPLPADVRELDELEPRLSVL
jgi:hypothetical protein